jgi:hypothetical protein
MTLAIVTPGDVLAAINDRWKQKNLAATIPGGVSCGPGRGRGDAGTGSGAGRDKWAFFEWKA